MAKRVLKPKDLIWTYDLQHGGQLFRRIREERDIKQIEIGKFCFTDKINISRFEKGLQPDFLECYIKALQSGGFEEPLNEYEADVLRDIYLSGREREKRQDALSWIRFGNLRSGQYPELEELVDLIRKIDKPAFIMDPSLSVHAINEASLWLFKVDTSKDSPDMNRWEFWNNLSSKLYGGSSIYKAHVNPDGYFPHAISALFQSKIARPYWFTWQMRVLVRELRSISTQVEFPFGRAWKQVTSFMQTHRSKEVNRFLKYTFADGRVSEIHADADFDKTCTVTLPNKLEVPFVLGVWKAHDDLAREAFAEIQRNCDANTLYYPEDYEPEGVGFHINTWPEVEAGLGGIR